jgi:hypothetical protein
MHGPMDESRGVKDYMSYGRKQATDTSRASRTRVTSSIDLGESFSFAIIDSTHVTRPAALQTPNLDMKYVMNNFDTLDYDIALGRGA